jgi:hypothetical protein
MTSHRLLERTHTMLLFIAFMLFVVLFAAWLVAPATGKVERTVVMADGAMPRPTGSTA